ncbi:uncharacterized protein LOC123705870 [Colias croceus]|uniref:uncharacterized protein LOC123705870 n=1 Tax=Colias crocea TaxID=72248 RepID=UPI001E280989|nr:uncharacterized protein LOC123705870 [Colias croceus]
MPLTQEKRLDSNFSNNNDHSYLHKKFKKMASTISVLPASLPKSEENVQRDNNIQSASCTSIPNGSIAAAHPEIVKIKDIYDNQIMQLENNVQTNFKYENSRLSDVNNIQVSGKTSYSEEFLKKTENYENDFSKDACSGVSGRYICPYCKLSCAKPSVLQKHIRAHTNERPYPCVPCGFAFKTKSNLYKHRRSRTHALRLQGADISNCLNDEDLSGDSESDTSIPPTSLSDTGSDASIIRIESTRNNEFSSPELTNDGLSNLMGVSSTYSDNKLKTIYKPKFSGAFNQNDEKDKIKKTISSNADFLTEHISKIISDNEAIVDVIETPLQKKYNKIKQIAESKQFHSEREIKQEITPLNLTKNTYEIDSLVRKRSHSESFTHTDEIKHPLNPEGSIIKDLLLKTKANGINSLMGEIEDSMGPVFVCPLCQIMYRSADNLEIHRLYYCKGNLSNNVSIPHKDLKNTRPENVYVRSNSINVRLPENQNNQATRCTISTKSPPLRNKPENLVIIKPESDIIAPLPSPGPLLGNTRLVDSRLPTEFNRLNESLRMRSKDSSPKRRLDSRSDTYSPRLIDNVSPRSLDLYTQPKIRCIDSTTATLRAIDEMQLRHNSTSLQMFGGEVKIVDHSGSTTTLRIEPSKNQLSPIMIQQNLSPSKFASDSEASSVVVRSGLHSGGTIVHNPPTPKENMSTPQTPRISVSTPSMQSGILNMHDISHFQFPPLSAITAYNPLTLPPLSPSSSPNGATTILHGGKLIPHVPGIPGPNTTGVFVGTPNAQHKGNDNIFKGTLKSMDGVQDIKQSPVTNKNCVVNYDKGFSSRNSKLRLSMPDTVKYDHKDTLNIEMQTINSVPIITVKNVDEPIITTRNFSPNVRTTITKQDNPLKRCADGSRIPVLKENSNYVLNKSKSKEYCNSNKIVEKYSDNEIKPFNFENIITKAEIYNKQIQSSSEVQRNTNAQDTSAVSLHNERSETSYFQKNLTASSASEDRKPKFLRPSTLPLKPGTFTPKRHHGITPNANTMPLVSPETPRPAKAYGQLYLNGNAYTYLGLKCSTKVFYCTINRPQPTYVPNQHFLSMYSNWQLLSELTPDPLGLSASSAMSLYDSRHRPQNVAVAVIKQDLILTHSSQWNKNLKDNKQAMMAIDKKKEDNKINSMDCSMTTKKELTGGFESNEEYTYVRGRGRGRYVCSECGIRCKKPSMLKKHIRTHTDVRPYTCVHCAFSFKTKGNLTKHMKSKAHYKKCCELGINPNEGNDSNPEGVEMTPCPEETDDETDSDGDDGNEGETESSDTEFCKSRLPEHEAAHCLLSLGGNRPATTTTPGLITSARPSTYPYTPIISDSMTLDYSTEKLQVSKSLTIDTRMEMDNNEPMDLSKSDLNTPTNLPEIPTARESSVLASLASNTAKLPQHQTQWVNGEPMLHTYLTEMALLDSKIKQSQLTSNISKVKKIELEKSSVPERDEVKEQKNKIEPITSKSNTLVLHVNRNESISTSVAKEENITPSSECQVTINGSIETKTARTPSNSNPENAKQVVSEYLKHARISLMKTLDESGTHETSSDDSNGSKVCIEEKAKIEDMSEGEVAKLPLDDSIAPKIVIGGVAFKVNKDKDYDSTIPYSPGKLMDDGHRVCDFCNKTFTKPSQLKLHLNIHYMERPFRCSVCAVSFRTKGHLQKHERSGSHHNKVSMTSTFGAATSFNPRPFRCSDCNIAFRIHGHLAKHLRSKMHVMRLECLFKLPFGTFTEIERAGLSLTDIDTTDCASSLASLQTLARKLHEKDPTRLEYREPSASGVPIPPAGRESSEEEEVAVASEKSCENEHDSEMKTIENSDCQETERNTFSATDN